MQILYLGLSNNIRGVAESLQRRASCVHFVKPGEITSRSIIAQQILSTKSVDIIIAAEITSTGIPQSQSIIQGLRERGARQPVFGLTNRFTEKTLAEFLNAGGNILLPFRPANDGYFTFNGNLLWSQIDRLKDILASRPPTAQSFSSHSRSTSPPSGASAIAGSLLFYGFALTPNGDFSLYGRELSLSPRDGKLLEVFMKTRANIMSPQEIRQKIYDGSASVSDGTIREAVSALRKRIKDNLNSMGCSFKFPIIEAVVNEGWRFHIPNLVRLNELLAPDQPMDAANNTPDEWNVRSYRSDHGMLRFKDFSFDLTKPKIHFRGVPLEISCTYVKVLTAIFRAEGAVVSRQKLYGECYPPDTSVSEAAVAPFVNRASKKLVAELQQLGFIITFPLIETIGKSGWALKQDNLERLNSMRPELVNLELDARSMDLAF